MKRYLLIVFAILGFLVSFAQNDSLILVNGNVIVGEIKSMDRGVLSIETDYSDGDFKIEWDGIDKIYTVTNYMITLSDGSRLYGSIESLDNKTLKLSLDSGTTREINFNNLVFLKSIDTGFWDQFYASIDIGFDLARANHLATFSTRSNVGYLAKKWSADITFNSLTSTQDSVDAIRRTDGGITYNYYLPRDWYIPISIKYLTNSEQRLDARWSMLVGVGKYVVHSNRVYWGFDVGASLSSEKYSPLNEPSTKTNSWEGYLGSELNLFDIDDFSLLTKVKVYPSFTNSGRWRSDFNLDTKYDLPLDFYVKIGFSVNYDNQPVTGASELDYVIHTGFGWEW